MLIPNANSNTEQKTNAKTTTTCRRLAPQAYHMPICFLEFKISTVSVQDIRMTVTTRTNPDNLESSFLTVLSSLSETRKTSSKTEALAFMPRSRSFCTADSILFSTAPAGPRCGPTPAHPPDAPCPPSAIAAAWPRPYCRSR